MACGNATALSWDVPATDPVGLFSKEMTGFAAVTEEPLHRRGEAAVGRSNARHSAHMSDNQG